MSISNLTYGSSELRERLVTKGASEIVVMAIKSFPTNAGTIHPQQQLHPRQPSSFLLK